MVSPASKRALFPGQRAGLDIESALVVHLRTTLPSLSTRAPADQAGQRGLGRGGKIIEIRNARIQEHGGLRLSSRSPKGAADGAIAGQSNHPAAPATAGRPPLNSRL